MYKKFRKSNKQYENESTVGMNPGRPPAHDGNGSYDDMISVKALKDLPKHPISLMADPYTSALPGSLPYPLLNKFNRVVGGRYSGEKNLDGGNVQQYANSLTSRFLSIFDSALLKLHLNYRYLPILASDTTRGNLMVDEMRRAISEACSLISATTFTAQNIYFYGIDTDLPMGSATKKTVTLIDDQGTTTTVQLYTDIADVIYAFSMEYQLVLQSVALTFNQFNANRLKMGEMIRCSFNRETPVLNSFFGLLKKKSFLSLWDSLAYSIEGEYVDQDWMIQANTLGLVSSRRSESMNDPLLEISSVYNFPETFKAYIATSSAKTQFAATPVYDFDSMVYSDGSISRSFQTACALLAEYMSANSCMKWARTAATNGVSENDRFNDIKLCLDVLTHCMSYFKVATNDLRSVFDIMVRSGVNQWTKGVKLKVIQDTDSQIMQNLIVDNIYQSVLSGCDQIDFNDTTKRWSFFTKWNMYYGIPEHDTYAGGSFLTFSTKTLNYSQSSDTNIGYVPVAFTVDTSTAGALCRVINRKGEEVALNYQVVTMSQDRRLARLVPLASQDALTIRVPNVMTAGLTDIQYSFLYKLLLQMFDMARIPVGNTYDIGIDADIVAIYNLEIQDFTNEVIAYARSKSPFIANSIDTSNLGFYGMKLDHK